MQVDDKEPWVGGRAYGGGVRDPAPPTGAHDGVDRAARARSFGAVAREYDRLRPAPLAQAVAWCVPGGARRVLDLAAGTGLMTRVLLAAGLEVVAVEPDEAMREVLADRTPGVEVLAGVGEQVPLADASVDAVVVASAWHWMDPVRAVPEIARVLRDGGRFAAVWTSPDAEVDWVRDLRAAEHFAPGDGGSAADRGARHRVVDLPPGSPFADVETTEVIATRTAARGDVLALLGTYSRSITAGASGLARARTHAEAVLSERFGDAEQVELPVRARCWRAARRARG